ncbi:MAG: hypothetical protein ACYS19_01315 [Planctomycetota bacterium]
MWPKIASADGFNLIPSIALREEFNDNIFFSVEDEVDDLITTISAGLDIVENSERVDADLKGRLDKNIYADNDDLNAVDQYYLGRLDYNFTERLSALANAGYIRDSRPDRDVAETGLVQTAEPRKYQYFLLGGDYLTSENTSNALTYQYQRSDYDDREFSDSRIHSLDFTHTWNAHRYFKETIGRVVLGYANADFETSSAESVSGTIGASWNYSEALSILFDLGVRYTSTDFITVEVLPSNQIVETKDTTRDWNGVGRATIEYEGEYTNGSLVFLHDIREARGRGGTVVRTGLTGSYGRHLSENIDIILSASYYRNKSDEGTVALTDLDDRTLLIRPSLRYNITHDIFLEVSYYFARIRDDIAKTTATQNIVLGQVYWQWPLFD